MAQPRVFLLDEPSRCRDLRDRRGTAREGRTILLVEEDARTAPAICDYAHVMESGRISMEGRGVDLLANDAMVSAYFGGTVAPSQG